ncbi:glutamine-rich protein 2 [Orycteropus afer afer]|uniref:Glutamine-rich protein 2 n=1 Tax=Orycteropus afer afer TaxID=1230840 RepID=A0A8B7BEW1_ORYAF|nr:glutamine-rich protein 2 [Orycteropus afer afer]
MAASPVSLLELADLAIGTPEVGAVNFTALHSLIVAMLKSLNLHETQIDFQSQAAEQLRYHGTPRPSASAPQLSASKERRRSVSRPSPQGLERQVEELGGQVQGLHKQLKTVEAQVEGVVWHVQNLTAAGLGPDLREWLGERTVTPTQGPEKAMTTLAPQKKLAPEGVSKKKLEKKPMTMPVPKRTSVTSEPSEKPETSLMSEKSETSLMSEKSVTSLMSEKSVTSLMSKTSQSGTLRAMKDGEKAEVSITQAMGLLQDVMQEVQLLKEAHQKEQELSELKPQSELFFQKDLEKRVELLEKQNQERESFMNQVDRKLSLIPIGEDVTMVTWEELEQAITDGWKASQVTSETSTISPKRKGQGPLISADTSQSGVYTKHPSTDSTGGSAPAKTLSGSSTTGYPFERVSSRDRSRAPSAVGLPAREQHSRARDEAGTPRPHHPSASHFRTELDRLRSRDQYSTSHPRRDEREAHPGPAQQDPALPRDQLDQRSLVPPGVVQRGLVPPGTVQRGLVPPGAVQQGLVPPGPDQRSLVPPGVVQRGLVPPGAVQRGLVPPGAVQRGLVPPGAVQRGLVPPGAVQRGLVPPGAVQHGLLPPGMDQHGLVQPGADQLGFVQPEADQYSLVQPGLVQPGMDQHGLVQPGADQRGLVQPGADRYRLVQPGAEQPGLVQPGADQHGLVQPGAGQYSLIQPGADQRGLVQPGTDQRGLVQPGAGQYRLVQPGTEQPGLVQPGADQRGLVQPGLVGPGPDQHDLVQPGADQRRLVPPGTDQHGLVQPGAEQRGLVQPGTDQRGLVQPGADQYSLVQLGADQSGLVQPGVVQPGTDQRDLVQPGADQRRVEPPGADQHGLVQPGVVQPGTDQRDLVQPGADQRKLLPPGTDQRGFVQPGAVQHGLVQPSADQHGVAQPGLIQHGLVQPNAYPHGWMQPGAYPPSSVQPGTYPLGLVPPGVGQHALVQPVADQRGLVQHGADQHDLVQPGAYPPSSVQPGADQGGLVQPGTDQRGFVQPVAYPPTLGQPGAYPPRFAQLGAYPPSVMPPGTAQHGLVQPGAVRHGLAQPGVGQLGLVQPGMDQRSLVQSGADQYGLVQPGMDQHGLIQPGADQRGLVQPDAVQRGLMQPGADQSSLVQPGTDQRGLVQPGADQHGLGQRDVDQRGLVQPGADQSGLVQPGADQHQQYSFLPDQSDHAYPGPMYPGSRGPGYPGADGHGQINMAGASYQPGTHPDQDTTFIKRIASPSVLYQRSLESVEDSGEQQDSLEKLAPSFPMAVETFRLMGELIGLYTELKEHITDLEEEKAGLTDLEKIQYMIAVMVKKSIPPDFQEQMKTLKSLTKEVRQEKAKVNRMQRILEGEVMRDAGKEMRAGQLGLQLGVLRVTVADIEKELAELRESQEQGKVTMANSVSEASLYLQDQLDKLRTIIESMMTSSSTLLSLSMAPPKAPVTLTPGQIDPEATCPACSLDVSHQVSTLVQRYEHLQDMVNNLAASRPSKKARLQSQDEELLGHVQSAILQVQGDCEKLNITTSNLIKDHREKQKDIDVLYQGLERLDKEKANREHLEMEINVKADKSALAGKVSRVQFDTTTEQLNYMMQELLAKISGQEQDWQKMVDKLLLEMDSKLDRLELDPVKQLLEERWKSLRQQLKERSPLYQADEAAIMRRQLLVHFHCLSCDRPLETPVTGQITPVTPVSPCLPKHRSIRPYTIFELEQVRQQSRNLKVGSAFPRGDLGQLERSVGRLRTIHSRMLMDIEKVQLHFGGSVKASSQMIRELLQAQCLTSPCYKRVPDMPDYTYSSVPRSCGGSHTLTYPYRRNRLQHLPQGLYPSEEIQIAMKHDEVDILGLDGHIYKGRMDTRLPGILTKETQGLTKHKSKQSRLHVQRQQPMGDKGQVPSRPQSAQMTVGNNPAPSRQQKDRPVSSEGRLSRANLVHPPSPTAMEHLPAGSPVGLGLRVDVPPQEGVEEPTRGPRSTTAH